MKTFRIPEPEWAQAMFTRLKTMISNLKSSIDGAGYITQETDPTVPAWAKAANKPAYTASEVGALSTSDVANDLTTTAAGKVLDARQGKVLKDLIEDITLPTKTSDLTNDGDGDSPFATMDDLPTPPAVPTKTSDLTNDGDGSSSFATLSDLQQAVDSQYELLDLHTHRQSALTVEEIWTELKKVPSGLNRMFSADGAVTQMFTRNMGMYIDGIVTAHSQNYQDTIDRYYYCAYDHYNFAIYMGEFQIGMNPNSGEYFFTLLGLYSISSVQHL